MKANTRLFGKIDIEDSKIIIFKEGIIGFPDLKHFTLIYDEEKEGQGTIKWLQSMDDPSFALPVINPLDVRAGITRKDAERKRIYAGDNYRAKRNQADVCQSESSVCHKYGQSAWGADYYRR